MSKTQHTEFGRARTFLWPVHSYELKKLVPMLILFFLISLNYNMLRTMKDALIVTAKGSGAEVIPFIKVWVMFPMAIAMTFLFTRLTNRISRENVFYVMMGIFLVFFALFTFFFYPLKDSIHPHALADYFESILPLGLKGFVAMCRYWSFTAFYVMSELWGNIILFVLFWGFANEITRVVEAKRFYGIFGVGANFSGIAAGELSILLCRHTFNPNLPFGSDAWEQSLVMLTLVILMSGIISICIFRWMNTCILTDPRFYDPSHSIQEAKEGQTAPKLSIRENFAVLFRSKYLICIALIVIAYNVVINLVEVVWKHEVKALYPSPNDYNTYMAHVTEIIGIIATLTALFVSGNAIRKWGWTFTAMLTPVILLISSVAFFVFFFLKESWAGVTYTLLGMSPLALAVFFGSAQNCMSRAAKYTVFDATKELSFIPLDAESKLKGKAVIDGVCSRLGKSGGSVIHQFLLICCSTVSASAPYVAFSLLICIVIWMAATLSLGKKFNALTSPNNEKDESYEPLVKAKEDLALAH